MAEAKVKAEEQLLLTEYYGVEIDDITFTTSAKSIVIINKITGKAMAKSAGTDYVIAKAGNVEVRIKVVVQK
ncbi:MAG: hypothetical protein K0R21_708 [Anaerocolumna sp.]|nr:hypothetical protein [Anaerocolumna sp.]